MSGDAPAPDSAGPRWRTIGDRVAEGLVWAILAGGYFCHGYATNPIMRASAGAACAALGAWAIASFPDAERRDPRGAASRRVVAMFAFLAAWSLIQAIPLPVPIAEAISPARREIARAFADAGLETPARAPLALDASAARNGFHGLVGAGLFFAGVCTIVRRRDVAARLFVGAGWIAAVEGVRGLAIHLAGAPRAHGVAFNPNHHAAVVLMGLAPFFARVVQAHRFTPSLRDTPLFGGSNPLLIPFAIGVAALAGWSATLSRASFAIGGAIGLAWVAVEAAMERRERAAGERFGSRLATLAGAGALAAAFAALVVAGSFAERFARRTEGLASEARPALWGAALRGLADSPWTGLGLGGTLHAIDRHADLPLETLPIHAHNDPVEWLADLGIPAFAIAAAMVVWTAVAWWADAIRRRSETPWAARLAGRASLVAVATGLGHSLADFPLRVPWVGFFFLIQLALALQPGPLVRATIAPVRGLRFPRAG